MAKHKRSVISETDSGKNIKVIQDGIEYKVSDLLKKTSKQLDDMDLISSSNNGTKYIKSKPNTGKFE